jgi:hypothetical protein
MTTAGATPDGSSFVEWGAVIAGAVLASALSFVFLTFGTAIGLSATSPWRNSGMSVQVVASLAILWAMIQQIASFMIGGYVAGRMRSRWREPTQHEVEFRDGLHGGLVWALGVVIGAALFVASAGAAARTGTELLGHAFSGASSTSSASMDSVVDGMLRGATVAQAGSSSTTPSSSPPSSPQGAGASGGSARAAGPANPGDQRAEIARIMTASVTSGQLSDQDRSHLAQLVAQRTGLSQQEAEKRVNDAFASAREAADKARRGAVLTGFVTAASLIISFGAAWWAAMKGGNHRDNSVPARFEFGLRRRTGLQ